MNGRINSSNDNNNNKIQLFHSPIFGDIRVLEIDGEPWFVGKDVAEKLGYVNGSVAISKKVDKEDKGVSKMETPGGSQDLSIINESGLYSLILSSKLDSAKEFKRWVTSEVLPSIRKHGAYMTDSVLEKVQNNPDMIYSLAEALLTEKKKTKELENKLEGSKRAVEYFDNFVNPDDVFSIRETAKELNCPERKLIEALIERRILFRTRDKYKKLLPTSTSMEKNYFVVKDYYLSNVGIAIPRTFFTTLGKEYVKKLIEKGKLNV